MASVWADAKGQRMKSRLHAEATREELAVEANLQVAKAQEALTRQQEEQRKARAEQAQRERLLREQELKFRQ